jgi:hypothetical protein
VDDQGKYWFRAKRYGYGWGLPCRWQGWAVLIGYAALILARKAIIPRDATATALYVLGLTAALIVICRLKGPPPKWRWGEED